jgi:hypothetical protein
MSLTANMGGPKKDVSNIGHQSWLRTWGLTLKIALPVKLRTCTIRDHLSL